MILQNLHEGDETVLITSILQVPLAPALSHLSNKLEVETTTVPHNQVGLLSIPEYPL